MNAPILVPLCHNYPFKSMHSLETEINGVAQLPEGNINSLVFYSYNEAWK